MLDKGVGKLFALGIVLELLLEFVVEFHGIQRHEAASVVICAAAEEFLFEALLDSGIHGKNSSLERP